MDDFLEAVARVSQNGPSDDVVVYATYYGELRLNARPDGSVCIKDPDGILKSIDWYARSCEMSRAETRETNLAELVKASM